MAPWSVRSRRTRVADAGGLRVDLAPDPLEVAWHRHRLGPLAPLELGARVPLDRRDGAGRVDRDDEAAAGRLAELRRLVRAGVRDAPDALDLVDAVPVPVAESEVVEPRAPRVAAVHREVVGEVLVRGRGVEQRAVRDPDADPAARSRRDRDRRERILDRVRPLERAREQIGFSDRHRRPVAEHRHLPPRVIPREVVEDSLRHERIVVAGQHEDGRGRLPQDVDHPAHEVARHARVLERVARQG